jgi:hypothetical protein
VKANGWDDLVVGENTKEARAIVADITGQPTEESTMASRSAATTTEQKG